jgi:tRNA(fMet)-specific endonuclease VapC
MKPALIDTDILSLFLRGEPAVVSCFAAYLQAFDRLNISIITYYEILSGLRYRDANKQLERFLELIHNNNLLPLTVDACGIAAMLYADLRKQGNPIDDIDLLIAGIALENKLVIATRNVGHFNRVQGLAVEDWTKD